MFGELDDSNIYESFDAFSSDESDPSEFVFGDSQEAPQENDDFLDMSSYNERMAQQQEQIQVPAQEPVVEQQYQQEIDIDLSQFDAQEIPVIEDTQADEQAAYQQQAQQPAAEQSGSQNQNSIGGVVILLLFAILALAAGGLFYYKNFMAGGSAPSQSAGDYFYDQASEQAVSQNVPNNDMATVDVDLNTAPQQAVAPQEGVAPVQGSDAQVAPNVAQKPVQPAQPVVKEEKELTLLEKTEQKEKQDKEKEKLVSFSNRVTIPVSAGGRMDPFVPYKTKVAEVAATSKFELIAPPTTVPEVDAAIDDMVRAKISGIMFDSVRPSAIVNIGGVDQLVHKGDVVNGYSVLDITKNSVTLKYNANIYKMSIGETVGRGVNNNSVSNLNKSFGGVYTETPSDAIKFN